MRAAALARVHPLSAAATPAAAAIAVRSCGAIAHRALLACDGLTRPVPGFEATPFRLAGDELIWIGVDAPVHPRAALIDFAPIELSATRLAAHNSKVHTSETLGGQGFLSNSSTTSLTRAILRLVQDEKPAGFGRLLPAQALPFPLSHRRDAAIELAQSCADNDAETFTRAALRLLGAGSGLTPSGDDFVGGALFALHAFGVTGGAAANAWNETRDSILTTAPSRTHLISNTLLHDLARGESYASLHALAIALQRCDEDTMLDAMRALITIGHSSGWDMLTGFIAAISGTRHFARTRHST